jgi:putative ATP-dependent endonuclease of OLD family
MAITLSEIKIRNFRSCAEVEIPLSRFTALVGYNNSGKSNILAAITWLLRRFTLGEADFFDPSKPVEIEATFSEIVQEDIDLLAEHQKKQIEPYVLNKTLGAVVDKRWFMLIE